MTTPPPTPTATGTTPAVSNDLGEELCKALGAATRDHGPRVLSILATRFGDLDLADDAVQDALVDAARTWSTRGVPDNPGGWLMTVAGRRAIDARRREQRAARRLAETSSELLARNEPADAGPADLIDRSVGASRAHEHHAAGPCATSVRADPISSPPTDVGQPRLDERLRLILLCCHPALDESAQIALTLRLVAGLTTAEISAAFLVPEPTLAQRIVRAKRKIRDANIPLSLPEELDDRLAAVLGIVYLVFNEGYLARAGAENTIRSTLVSEAIRLSRLLVDLLPDSAECQGLLALELFHAARASSRIDEIGDLILLEDQDRDSWDTDLIAEGNRIIAAAMSLMTPGVYQVQALIASQHANARSPGETDWSRILDLYDQLIAMTGSPVVALNRAVAVAQVVGASAGLDAIDQIEGLDEYHLLWACRGELEHRRGHRSAALTAFRRALDLTSGLAERRHLERRIAELES